MYTPCTPIRSASSARDPERKEQSRVLGPVLLAFATVMHILLNTMHNLITQHSSMVRNSCERSTFSRLLLNYHTHNVNTVVNRLLYPIFSPCAATAHRSILL